MACPTLIFADQLIHYPFSQIGELGVRFGELFAQDIPLPPLLVIPQETLLRILRDTGINLAHEDIHTLTAERRKELAGRYAAAIRHLAVPAWFASEFLKAYHQQFEEGFVQLKPSQTRVPAFAKKYENIMGEANCLESVLELWADLVSHSFETAVPRHELLLAPEAIVVQAQYQPIVSGVAQSSDLSSGKKHHVIVAAIWGAPMARLLEEVADTFAVDVRTWQVVQRKISKKSTQYFRDADSLTSENVPLEYQKHASLTDEQVVVVAGAVFAIKQKSLQHQLISWELTTKGFFVTHIRELQTDHQATTNPTKTITKLYISTGNPEKHAIYATPLIDGVGVLRSEYAYAKFGVHPISVLHSKQKHVLHTQLVATIQAYQHSFPFKPVLFRSINFTSNELRYLKQAPTEPPENNPYLGYRGGLQLLRQPELLEFELGVLTEVLKTSRAPIGLLLPFMRTASELEVALQKIEKSGILQYEHFGVWLQANTPENLLTIRSFPTQKLQGISVNIRSIHALLVGADPDTAEIYEQYNLEMTGLYKLLEEFSRSILELQNFREFTAPLKLHMHIEQFSHELVALAVKLGYYGVVVKPAVAQLAHASILELESKRLALLK